MGELRSILNVDLSRVANLVREIDFKAVQSEKRVGHVEQRERAVRVRLDADEAKAKSLEQIATRAGTMAAKRLGRAGATYVGGIVLSEMGMPEALQPVMRVGSAALAGAQFGGPAGALAFATIASVQELAQYLKAIDRRVSEIAERLVDLRETQKKDREALERRALAREEALKDRMAHAFEAIREEAKERAYQTWQLQP